MKLKGAGFDASEKAIYKWFMNSQERNVPVSGPMLKELQTDDFKDFKV